MGNKVVYAWLNAGTPFYIGIGSLKRSRTTVSRNRYCLNKRAKAERENSFEVRILHENLTWKEACELEQSYISLYGRTDNNTGILTNMTDGGEGSYGKKHTQETLRKMSLSSSGSKHPMFGKSHTKETKEKMSLSHKGERNHQYRKPLTECTKRKIGEANTGKNNPSSLAVMTPLGTFESYRLAGEYLGCSHVTVSRRVKNNKFPDYYTVSP